MDYYEIWCNLKKGVTDLEFCAHVENYLGYLKEKGLVEDYRIRRRKFGFGPAELGEFNISIMTRNLEQLDQAFLHVATRSGEVEALHHPVYSSITDFKSALYRDFPDSVRVREQP